MATVCTVPLPSRSQVSSAFPFLRPLDSRRPHRYVSRFASRSSSHGGAPHLAKRRRRTESRTPQDLPHTIRSQTPTTPGSAAFFELRGVLPFFIRPRPPDYRYPTARRVVLRHGHGRCVRRRSPDSTAVSFHCQTTQPDSRRPRSPSAYARIAQRQRYQRF